MNYLNWQTPDPFEGLRLMVSATFDQRAYRFRNDNGNQSTATWKANQNTTITQTTGETFRLRIAVQETAGGSANNQTIVLQRNINGTGWVDVGPSSNGVRLNASPHVTDNTPTTRQLTGTTGTFIAGTLLTETSGTNISFSGNDHTEVEWASLLITPDVPDGATVQFRVTINGSLPATTTASPSLTAVHPEPQPPSTAPILSSSSKTTTSIDLSWNTVEDSDTYQLQRKLTSEDDLLYVTIQATSATSRDDTGLNPGTSYTYRVRGVNASGVGPWSTPVTETTDALPVFDEYGAGSPLATAEIVEVPGEYGLGSPLVTAEIIPVVHEYLRAVDGTIYVVGGAIESSGYESVIFEDDPVAVWPLGETEGTTATSLVGPTGTYVNSPLLGQSGAFSPSEDTSVRFRSTNSEHVNLGTSSFLTGVPFSVEMWVAPKDPTNNSRVFAYGEGSTYLSVFWHDQKLQVRYSTSNNTGNAQAATFPITEDGFCHFVWTFNGSTHTVYVNGEVSTGGSISALGVGQSAGHFIARRSGGNHFDGRMQYVAVYNSVLTQARVKAHHLAGREVGTLATEVVLETGSLREYLLNWEGAEVPVQSGYVKPTIGETQAFADAFTHIRLGDPIAAVSLVSPFRYEVVEFFDTDTGRDVIMLRERRNQDGTWRGAWGTYIWDPEGSETVVQSPHTVWDWRVTELSNYLYQIEQPCVLMLAGASRHSGTAEGGGSAGDTADVANYQGPSIFQAIHESLFDIPNVHFINMHGFFDSSDADMVVSYGTDQPIQWVRDLAAGYEALSLPDGVRLFAFDADTNTALTASGNVQGVSARAASKSWVHLEHERSLRMVDTQWQDVQQVTADLTPAEPLIVLGKELGWGAIHI